MSFYENKDKMNAIIIKYPDRIPVLLSTNNKIIPPLRKNKYLVPRQFTFGELIYTIRLQLPLESSVGLFLSVNNTLPAQNETIQSLYLNHVCTKDNTLHVNYEIENTFGCSS